MKKSLSIILIIILLCIGKSYSQYKLKDIPYKLSSINKKDKRGKQGIWFYYDRQDSNVYSMKHYVNDTLNGYFEMYWITTGKISDKGFYKNGKFDSTFVAYWEDGKVRGEVFYANGLLEGISTCYNRMGDVSERLKYHLGKIDSSYTEAFIDSNMVWDKQPTNKMDTLR